MFALLEAQLVIGRDFRGGRDRYGSRDSGRGGGSYNSYSRERGYYNSNDRRGGSGSGSGGGYRGGYNDRKSGEVSSYRGGYNKDRSSYGNRDRNDRDRRRDVSAALFSLDLDFNSLTAQHSV